MQIWPAIDLRNGKCVRLRQGDYEQETVFSTDPVETARRWAKAGARYLHLVDLDGARRGNLGNRESIRRVIESVDLTCEVGGGIRDESTIRELLGLGVERLVIGTQAIKQPGWFSAMCRQYPGRLVLGIDARGGRVATEGWTETSTVGAVDLARQHAAEPLAGIIYTDIQTDGMLTGPNLQEIRTMAESIDLPLIASGGVRSLEDIAALARLPVAGVIVGRALYEGELDLQAALDMAAAN
jgi:phosphoribosylformimino-5-aminoimidazole carboxamide ribotide isomerase